MSGMAIEFKNDGKTHLEIVVVNPLIDGKTGAFRFFEE
ncbi:UNVERIFIED_ORG: hypothetical protein J2S99_004521 [Atlantibacter hermannii]|nr:hypothetical protein [Atlantibacter hermannii]